MDFKDVNLGTSFSNMNYTLGIGGDPISREGVYSNVMPYQGLRAIEWIANGSLGTGI
jgi:hypothetical protein